MRVEYKKIMDLMLEYYLLRKQAVNVSVALL